MAEAAVDMSYEGLRASNVSPGSLLDDYELFLTQKPLGSGGYAHVFAGTKKDDGEQVAVKILKRFNFRRPGKEEHAVQKEIHFMKMLTERGAEHIVSFRGAYETEIRSYLRLCIVTARANGGDLFERIANQGRYNEQIAGRAFSHAMRGVRSMHRNGVVHRDLKPENLLLADNSDDSDVLVADFGLSEYLAAPMRMRVGTLAYNAPENLQSPPVYSEASDVWAMGIVLFIMLSGSPPFYADHRLPKREHDRRLAATICAGKFVFYPSLFGNISQEVKDLIASMLQVDPSKRPTVDQVLEHDWVKRYDTNSDAPLGDQQKELRKWNARAKLRAAAFAALLGGRARNDELSRLTEGNDFTKEEVRAIRDQLREKSRDGRVDANQFKEVMTALGYTGLPLDRVFQVFDEDGSGVVDAKEFVVGLSVIRGGGTDTIRMLFDVMDTDGSGSIDRDELAVIIGALSTDEMTRAEEHAAHLSYVFDAMDVNKDGSISYDEFEKGMQSDASLVEYFMRPLDAFGGDAAAAATAISPKRGAPAAGGGADA